MVDILLATFNSEKYLEEQIDSILLQTYKDWKLIIRDDNSTDRTLDIFNKYISLYPDKISIVKDNIKCGSAKNNFLQLLSYAENDYVMFCDHDDYWLKNKIEISVNKLIEGEKRFNKSTPLVVFTKYFITDSQLNQIKESNSYSNKTLKSITSFNRLLVQNYLNGCTMIFNKSLYSAIGNVIEDALMHDWWVALYASAFGKILFANVPTIKYRQHENNCVGAINVKSIKYIISKIKDINTKHSYEKLYNQAVLFNEIYKLKMDLRISKIINKFIQMQNMNKVMKIYTTLRYNFCKSNFIRIIGQIFYI